MKALSTNTITLAATGPALSLMKIKSAIKALAIRATHLAGIPNWLDAVAAIKVTNPPATPGVIIDLELRKSFIVFFVSCRKAINAPLKS
jgi:hypothetical protein